jgi:hypothetical protein
MGFARVPSRFKKTSCAQRASLLFYRLRPPREKSGVFRENLLRDAHAGAPVRSSFFLFRPSSSSKRISKGVALQYHQYTIFPLQGRGQNFSIRLQKKSNLLTFSCRRFISSASKSRRRRLHNSVLRARNFFENRGRGVKSQRTPYCSLPHRSGQRGVFA